MHGIRLLSADWSELISNIIILVQYIKFHQNLSKEWKQRAYLFIKMNTVYVNDTYTQ